MRFIAAWACVLFAAVQARGQTPAQTRELSLSVLTYNIRYDNPGDGEDRWEKRRDEVAKLIRDHDPDVVGLQEALRNQLDDLGKALPGYGEIGVGRDDGKTKGEYAAILYRKERFKAVDSGTFWFSDTPEVAGSKSWGNNCVRICTWAILLEKSSGLSFSIYNVHLDHESQASREKSTELLEQRVLGSYAGDKPWIVTGDFNAGEENPATMRMTAPRMQVLHEDKRGCRREGLVMADSYRVVHPDEKDAGTFNDFGHGHGTKDKIDYIWVQHSAKVENAGIDRRSKDGHFPSDHHAVWARVTVPQKGEP